MNRTLSTLLLVGAVSAVSGCASRDANLTAGVEDPCATVQGLIAEYPEGFPSYRGKATNVRNITTYRAKEDLVAGHCEIWQWGSGDTAYSCSATAPSTEPARIRRDTGRVSDHSPVSGAGASSSRPSSRAT